MTERTCGGDDGTKACAWWDFWEQVRGVRRGKCRHLVGPSPKTDSDDVCPKHATTREWGEQTIEEQAAEEVTELRYEIDRLKARCQEARKLLEDAEQLNSSHDRLRYGARDAWDRLWYGARDAWLESSDDE